jgi:hypothetical protein
MFGDTSRSSHLSEAVVGMTDAALSDTHTNQERGNSHLLDRGRTDGSGVMSLPRFCSFR